MSFADHGLRQQQLEITVNTRCYQDATLDRRKFEVFRANIRKCQATIKNILDKLQSLRTDTESSSVCNYKFNTDCPTTFCDEIVEIDCSLGFRDPNQFETVKLCARVLNDLLKTGDPAFDDTDGAVTVSQRPSNSDVVDVVDLSLQPGDMAACLETL